MSTNQTQTNPQLRKLRSQAEKQARAMAAAVQKADQARAQWQATTDQIAALESGQAATAGGNGSR